MKTLIQNKMRREPLHCETRRRRKTAKRFWRNRSGAIAVEFAMIMPAFILLAFGVLEFGRALWAYNSLQYAVEEVARVSIIDSTQTNIAATALAGQVSVGLDPAALAINLTTVSDVTSGLDFIVVDGTYQFEFLVKNLNVGPLTLTSSTRVPVIN